MCSSFVGKNGLCLLSGADFQIEVVIEYPRNIYLALSYILFFYFEPFDDPTELGDDKEWRFFMIENFILLLSVVEKINNINFSFFYE